MSKRTGNRDAKAAKKRRKRHRKRASRSWHSRHLVILRPDGDYDVWPISIDECANWSPETMAELTALLDRAI